MLSDLTIAQTAKSRVTYYSYDSLLINADEYFVSDSLPYILLFHEQGSSRGEFYDLARRFQKMNYNCLAIDVRNGGNSNVIGNETARRCRQEGLNRGVNAIEEDIKVSIEYAFNKSGLKVVLLGAGANGALVLKAAKENEHVRAAIALSPGEYFQAFFSIQETIAGIQKPILITSSIDEYPYIEKIVSQVDERYKTVLAPEQHQGLHGTEALLTENANYGEYWLALLLFFKDLQ